MKMNQNNFLASLLFFLLLGNVIKAEVFENTALISNSKKGWNRIEIPSNVLNEINTNLTDLRIFAKGSKEEVPFIVQTSQNKSKDSFIELKILNKVQRNNAYYFTLSLENNIDINEIILDFENQNFDWKLELEASNNQSEWYHILKNYRIVSIKNNSVDFHYSSLNFQNSNFKYYRIKIKSQEIPEIKNAKIPQQSKEPKSDYINVETVSFTESNDNESKSSVLFFDLKYRVPISKISFYIQSNFDYYRRIKIEGAAESTISQKGEIFHYENIYNGILYSLESPDFSFPEIYAKRVKITIENENNQPLKFDSIVISRFRYYLLARFDYDNKYFLHYKNESVEKAKYDINYFEKSIPTDLNIAELKDFTKTSKKDITNVTPLIANSIWLWFLLIFIVCIILYFSFRFLKATDSQV